MSETMEKIETKQVDIREIDATRLEKVRYSKKNKNWSM